MAFILLRLLVLGVIAAAADDVQITWLAPPRGVVPCVVAEAGRAQRRPSPPLEAEDRPRSKPYRRKPDEELKRLSAEGSVEVTRKKNGTEGVYQCSVKHPVSGVVLGFPVRWKFASMENHFSKHPQNSTARAGEPFVLDCEISSAPVASISWLRDGETLPRDDRFIFLKTQLLFTEVRKQDAGVYKCMATNEYLNKTRTSTSGRLLVVDPEDLEPALLPLRDEVDVVAQRFSRVQLLCPVMGWPRPKITWEFTVPGGRTAILEYTEEVVTLSRLELDQEGAYKCTVDDYTHLEKMFNVTVTEPAVITLPPVSKEVILVSTIRFNCTASGRPAPTISWYKDGKRLELGSRFNIRLSTSGNRQELVVGGVTSGDEGVYQCFAQSGSSVASSWGVLSLTGASVAPPAAVRCWPLGAHAILVRWARPPGDFMVYTLQTTMPDWRNTPHDKPEQTIEVKEPLTPYGFQVRAFIGGPGKIVASDISEPVYCQGQGASLRITKQGDDAVLVSWKEFAEDTPGVVEWILQFRVENSTEERKIRLPGDVLNYTLPVQPEEPLQVRVLGSKSTEWLSQNLTYLVWTPTNRLQDAGDAAMIPEDFRVTTVWSNGISVKWRSPGTDNAYVYLICVRKADGIRKCLESYNTSATLEGLEPETEYEVTVQTGRPPGLATMPLLVTTKRLETGTEPERFKDLTCAYLNSTTIRVAWNAGETGTTEPIDAMGSTGNIRVHYSQQLDLSLELWEVMDAVGNQALVTVADPSKDTFVAVSGYRPLVYSPIRTVPAQVQDVQWSWTSSGVSVRWRGGGRLLRYSQNLTRSLELWPEILAKGSSVELTDLDPSLPTYVMVSTPGADQKNKVFNIPVRPLEPSHLYLGVGIAGGVFVLCLLAVAAVCIWRRAKRGTETHRYRRRNVAGNGEDEEAAELKNVGGRLANGGGSKDAGEPLLNGHVHITENPQSKAPNGKMKKTQMPFDLSRYEDPDATLETVLDDQSATYELLDTSRKPEDPLTTQHSFPKLPDDNMNSELNRSGNVQDNSKLQPTLQPNG